MANLDVTRKKKSPLPWILITLVILAIAGYFIWRNYNEQQTTTTDTTAPATTTQDSSNHLGADTTTRL